MSDYANSSYLINRSTGNNYNIKKKNNNIIIYIYNGTFK